ncbi:MAG: DNA recombination protein RmuC [Chitinophagaceae bacterium]|jgi:DNA recombination protein RmuC|nr:DNA recombination protein RmuC [Chitinophagaceae bacterium]MCA6467939.1 DNA recombination protein RmuC [Chitinophagaceae bacterium]MCA6469301.1 DNA recombination protein RmuC [Chitinophagaceae bacterium]MCA6476927.1 DNA recombination protein RmuC [Chitinophagaceae bacterium]MCA6480620.1 DNA recombination protein RmuC [Chitinophagaceae bacterium]
MESTALIYVVIALVGVLLGYLIAYQLQKSSRQLLQENVLRLDELLRVEKAAHESVRARLEAAEKQGLLLDERLNTTRQQLEEAKKAQQQISDAMKNEIELLATRLISGNTQQLVSKNEEKLGQLLQPLQQELTGFKKAVQDAYQKESNERFSLSKEIEKLVQSSVRVSEEANNLATALKGNSKTMGDWGEMVLETLLEHSGLIKDRNYFVQQYLRDASGKVIKDEEGNMLQPDVMIVYPDQRKVIIDAKVSLVAWDKYVKATDTLEKEKALQEHLASMYRHIEGLSKKKYGRYAEALDYVLMFVPIEPAFLESLKKDDSLWKRAYDKNIMLVSPTNLMAVLKIVADLWRIEKQNLNAIQIAEKAGALYDKFFGFLDNMEGVKKKLQDANTTFDEAYKQFYTGRGSMINRAEELKKMGANATKQIPEKLIRQTPEESSELPPANESAS